MQYIPIAAVPCTNTRSPQTTLLHRGREIEFNDRASGGFITAHTDGYRHGRWTERTHGGVYSMTKEQEKKGKHDKPRRKRNLVT